VNADEVLQVLNDLEPVDMSGWVFAVITDASDLVAGSGRMAGQVVQLAEPNFGPFEKGEVLVLAANGREPFAEGRNPDKWDVHAEEFATLAEALACREQVLTGAWPRVYG
jgi:hypothetical protein